MPKKNSSRNGIVYSTDPTFSFEESEEMIETLIPSCQSLIIKLETKHRAGKTVTAVHGFIGNPTNFSALEKKLKNHCGTGGSAKEGIILIQGDQREKIFQWLKSNGYNKTKIG
ncbi:MAG: translation initiation factor [Bacteroidetes bacterium]|nr:translation initiation factor [Bacteroidota bacterium]